MLIIRYLKQEPLLVFILIASVLFAADYSLNRQKKYVIDVTPETRIAILGQEKAMKGDDLTSSEEETAIKTYIDNKILLADAMRLGLDNDRTIHSVMLKKYRALKTATLTEPTADELDAHYNANKNKYMSPITYDIQQIFFGVGVSIPPSFETQLRSAENTDIFLKKMQLESTTLPKMSEREMHARMGKDVSDEVVKANDKMWVGPMTNERGTYFIRILARYESALLPLSEVKSFVRDDLILFKQDAILKKILTDLKANYSIHVAGGEKE